MALQKTVSIAPLALTLVDAYIRIEDVKVSVANGINIVYAVFSSAKNGADPEADIRPLSVLQAEFPFPEDQVMSGTNSIEWAYDQLKTLPEFSDAIDV